MDDDALFEAVREALNRYYDLTALSCCPLAELEAARALRPQEALLVFPDTYNRGLAIQRLLDEALASLEREKPYDAELLRQRFIKGQTIDTISNERGIGPSTVYDHQRKAVIALTAILAKIEAQARDVSAACWRHLLGLLPGPTYWKFVGANAQLPELLEALASNWRKFSQPMVVTGLGGLGKTSLVREALVRWLTDAKPDVEHILWATVVQSDSSTILISEERTHFSLAQVVNQLVERFDETSVTAPSPERQLHWLAQRLGQEQSVVVVDNVETPDDVRLARTIIEFLSPVALVIVTSRHRIDYPNTQTIDVREFHEPEAKQLLFLEAQRLGIEPIEGNLASAVWQQIGGNPLALKLVVAQTRFLPASRVLRDLQPYSDSMHHLFEYIYRTSWQLLSEQAQQMFLGLVLLPPAGATWEGLKQMIEIDGEPPTDAVLTRAVDELSALNLLQVSPALESIYSLHRLTYGFLEHQLGLTEP